MHALQFALHPFRSLNFYACCSQCTGIINSSGKEWVDIRRFTLRNLRDFGFGKQTQQNLALEEVREIVDWFKSYEGKPVKIDALFDLPTVNSLWAIMTGRRFSKDDPLLTDFMRKSNE